MQKPLMSGPIPGEKDWGLLLQDEETKELEFVRTPGFSTFYKGTLYSMQGEIVMKDCDLEYYGSSEEQHHV